MYCPDCGTANNHTGHDCLDCQSGLPTGCPSCGQINSLSNRFCCQCGSSLLALGAGAASALTALSSVASASAVQASNLTHRAERRQLTVLFCDLVGSTALSQHLDPEDLRDLIHLFQQQCAAAVGQFDGYVARYMGDGLLAYFGYPQAHELDAERAVRAGLAIVQRVTSMAKVDGHCLQVRVGIETGLVVAGDIVGQGEAQEHTVLGDTPNIAARLQALAAPDSVVIGPSIHGIVGGHFSCEGLGVQTLKGIAEPMAIFRVTAVTDNQNRFALVPVLGRDLEINQLLDCLAAANPATKLSSRSVYSASAETMSAGLASVDPSAVALVSASHGSVVVIEADSGFGKTRLLQQIVHLAAGSFERATLRCSPFYRDRPLYPLVRHWNSLLELRAAGDANDKPRQLRALLQAQGIKDLSVQRLLVATLLSSGSEPYSELASEDQRSATREAFIEVVRCFSRRKPMLLAVEDAHWIDSSTAEFLAQLSQQLIDLPVVLILTSREPLPWLSQSLSNLTRLQLHALPDQVLYGLIEAIDGQNRISDSIRRQILQRSDGSPLYVEELVKSILEQQDQADAQRQKGGPCAAQLGPIQVPASLQDSLRARLDRLGAAKDVAQFVSVLGRQFSYRLIRASCPFDPDQTELALSALVAAQLLIATGTGERRGFAFCHTMLQEVAYQSLLNRTRRLHHRRIAEAIGQHFAEMVATTPEVIASHYEAAGDTALAIQYWHQAGLNAAASWAHAEAVNHYRRAIALLDQEPEQQGSIDHTSTERLEDELTLRIDLVRSLRIIEGGSDGLEQLQRAEAIAQQLHYDHELAVVQNLAGNLRFSKGDIDGCLASHRAAIGSARAAGSVIDELQALSGLGDANLLRGHAITAENAFDRCLDLYRSLPEPRRQGISNPIEAPNLSLRGHLRLYLNRLVDSEQDVAKAVELALQTQDRRTEMVARGSCMAKTLCEMGRYTEARQHLQRALQMAQEMGVLRFESLYLLFIARTCYPQLGGMQDQQQDPQEQSEQQASSSPQQSALALAEQAIEIATRTDFRYVGAIAFGAKALALTDPQQRRVALDEGEKLLASNNLSQNFFWFLRDAIEVSLVDGNWDRARHYADLLQRYTAEQPLPWSDCYIGIAHCCSGFHSGDDGIEMLDRIAALRHGCHRDGLVAATALLEQLLPEAQLN